MRNYQCHEVFDYITEQNHQRSNNWHGDAKWTILEWAGAMCGEAGELANECKKLRRQEQGIQPGKDAGTREELIDKMADEVADTFLYLNLICAEAGIDMYAAIARKFNRISERDGWPQELVIYPDAKVVQD